MGQENLNEQTLLRQAIAAARAGQKTQARKLFRQVIALNRYHELAWLWLGGVLEDVDARVQCLENVLVINPDNAAARKGLAQLRAQTASPATDPRLSPTNGASASGLHCPHCNELNPIQASFCMGCGQRLSALPGQPAPRLEHDQAPAPPALQSKSWQAGLAPKVIHTRAPSLRARTPGAAAIKVRSPSPSGFIAFLAAILAYLGTAIPIGVALGFAGALIAGEMGYPKVTRHLFSTRIEPLPAEVQFLTVTLANWISMVFAGVIVARKRLGGSRKKAAFNCLIAGIGYVLLSIALQPQLSELIGLEIVNTTVSYIEFIFGPLIGMLSTWLAFRSPQGD